MPWLYSTDAFDHVPSMDKNSMDWLGTSSLQWLVTTAQTGTDVLCTYLNSTGKLSQDAADKWSYGIGLLVGCFEVACTGFIIWCQQERNVYNDPAKALAAANVMVAFGNITRPLYFVAKKNGYAFAVYLGVQFVSFVVPSIIELALVFKPPSETALQLRESMLSGSSNAQSATSLASLSATPGWFVASSDGSSGIRLALRFNAVSSAASGSRAISAHACFCVCRMCLENK